MSFVLTPDKQVFMSSLVKAALAVRPAMSLNARVLLTAWACHESGWGQSNPAKRAFNLWNVSKGAWTGPTLAGGDTEFTVGSKNPPKAITQQWRVYRSMEESVKDIFNFLENSPGFVNYREAAAQLMAGDAQFATTLGVLDRGPDGAIIRVDTRKGTAGFYTLPRKDYQKGVDDIVNMISGFIQTNCT
jgi:flagellum-specific peptidoglycan hydrolase FlgJ